jgi:hypothetical protein
MPELRDIARVRNVTTTATTELVNIPEVGTPEGLRTAAELVYHSVRAKTTNNSPQYPRDGTPGKHWQGRIRTEVFYELWPQLDDRMYVSATQRNEIIEAVTDYLDTCKVLVRKSADTKYNPSIWWVSDHWTPMEVRTVQPEPAQAPQAVPGAGYQCRGCDETFSIPSARGTHEYRSHKIAIDDAGTVYAFDENFNEAYTESLVLRVLKDVDSVGESVSFRTVQVCAHDIDPRMGKVIVKGAIGRLVSKGSVRQLAHGVYPKYALATAAPAEDDTAPGIPEEAAAVLPGLEPETAPEPAVQVTSVGPAVDSLTVSLDGLRHILSTTRGQFESAEAATIAVFERASWLEGQLARTERELAAAKMKLIPRGTAGPEAEALRATVQELSEKLAEAVRERDEVQSRLDNFQQALRGLGVQ